MATKLTFSRLVPGPGGVSHFETIEIPATLQDFAPPAQPFSVSAFMPASQCGFLHLPSGWFGEMHPSPIRMWIFVLKGEMLFQAGNGDERRIVAGDALLLEDVVGSGHVSRVVGADDVILSVVRLP